MRWVVPLPLVVVLLLGLARVAAAQSPGLTVQQPAPGSVVGGATVTVQFQVTGFTLVPSQVPLEQAGKRPDANRPGEGHLHFMLDLTPVVVWEKADPYTFANVPAGEHRLMVELVNNDHASLSPPVVRTVQFTVPPATLPRAGEGGRRVGEAVSDQAVAGLLAIQWLSVALAALYLGGRRLPRAK